MNAAAWEALALLGVAYALGVVVLAIALAGFARKVAPRGGVVVIIRDHGRTED